MIHPAFSQRPHCLQKFYDAVASLLIVFAVVYLISLWPLLALFPKIEETPDKLPYSMRMQWNKSGRAASETMTRTEFRSATRSGLLGSARNLSPSEMARVRFEFGKPTVEHYERRKLVYVVVPGNAFLLSKDGKSKQPIDWVQPISVALGRSYEVGNVDWKTGIDQPNTVCAKTCVNWTEGHPAVASQRNASTDGSFRAYFWLRDIRRPVGTSKQFQIAVAIATRTEDVGEWRASDSIVPSSIQKIEIAGPEALSPELQAINGCDFNRPITMIRSTNQLRALGKQRAIAALREYVNLAWDRGYEDSFTTPEAEHFDDSNVRRVTNLLPLLFEKDGQPFARSSSDLYSVENDIPFTTAGWPTIGIGWPSGNEIPLIDEAEKTCDFQTNLLRPTNDPYAAAGLAIAKLPEVSILREIEANALRQQARQLVASAFREIEPVSDVSNLAWEMEKTAIPKRIRWDTEKESYVRRIPEPRKSYDWEMAFHLALAPAVLAVLAARWHLNRSDRKQETQAMSASMMP